MTVKRKPGWYIVIETSDGKRHCVRGPYKYAETAAAVRSELERGDLDDDDEDEENYRNYIILGAAQLDQIEAAP